MRTLVHVGSGELPIPEDAHVVVFGDERGRVKHRKLTADAEFIDRFALVPLGPVDEGQVRILHGVPLP